MTGCWRGPLARAILVLGVFLGAAPALGSAFVHEDLPPLPEALAGQFVGVDNGALIVAGGAAPGPAESGLPIEGLSAAVHVLEAGAASWVRAGALPSARAWGGTFNTPEGLWLVGGVGPDGIAADGYLLRWEAGALRIRAGVDAGLPSLPTPRAGFGAAAGGAAYYAVGGVSALDGAAPLASALMLPADAPDAWQELPPLPGPGRLLPAAVARDGALYVAGGHAGGPDAAAGGPGAILDAHRFDGAAWQAIAPPPQPILGNALAAFGQAHLIGLGAPVDAGQTVLGFHRITGTWAELGFAPVRAGSAAAAWGGRLVFAGGPSGGATLLRSAPARGGFGPLDYLALGGYFAALIAMGWHFSRRGRGTEDFFLGGRRVPWWAVGLSIFGTSLSAITYLSIPARAFATDWVWSLANLGILFVAPFVVLFYLPHFRAAPITTAYEYLETRFNAAARLYGSICFLLFQAGRVAIVLYLPAIALSAATGLDIYLSIAAMGLLATAYTVLGGIEAVIWTDVLQAFVLTAGAVLALGLIAFSTEGGAAGLIATAHEAGKFHTFNWTWDHTVAAVWVVVIGNAFSSFYPATADQTVVQRYLSTRDLRDARRAVWTNALLTIPVTVLFFGLGTALWVYFQARPELLNPGLQNDAILPLFIVLEFPAGLKGIVIAGIFAASMSSLDSSLNSAAAVIVNDYCRKLWPRMSDRRALAAARWITLVLGCLGTMAALYLARVETVSLWDIFLQLLNLVGGGLAGIFALGVFTRRANGNGAVAGAIASACVLYYVSSNALTHFFLNGMIAFVTAFVAGYLASLALPGGGRKAAR